MPSASRSVGHINLTTLARANWRRRCRWRLGCCSLRLTGFRFSRCRFVLGWLFSLGSRFNRLLSLGRSCHYRLIRCNRRGWFFRGSRGFFSRGCWRGLYCRSFGFGRLNRSRLSLLNFRCRLFRWSWSWSCRFYCRFRCLLDSLLLLTHNHHTRPTLLLRLTASWLS